MMQVILACLFAVAAGQVSLKFQCETIGEPCRFCFPGSRSQPCLPRKFPFPTNEECKVECRDRSKDAVDMKLFQCPFASGNCVACTSAAVALPDDPNICKAPFLDFEDCQNVTICGSRDGVYCDFLNEQCISCTGSKLCAAGLVKKFKTFAQCEKPCRINPRFRKFYCTHSFTCEPCLDKSFGGPSARQVCPEGRPVFSDLDSCSAQCVKPERPTCKNPDGSLKQNEEFFDQVPPERDCNRVPSDKTGPGCACVEGTVREAGQCIDPKDCPTVTIQYVCSRTDFTCIQCGEVIGQDCPLDREQFADPEKCDRNCSLLGLQLNRARFTTVLP